LVVSAANYLAASNNVAFDEPANPGAQIAEVTRQHASNLKEYELYVTTEAKLKQQLLAAVPSTYTDELTDPILGYANVTTLQILQHLATNYGTLSTDDLNTNINKLNEDWSPSDPIETLFTRIRECRTFAQYDDPITEASAVRIAIQIVERSGVFGDAIKDWRKKADAGKTYKIFSPTSGQQISNDQEPLPHVAPDTTTEQLPPPPTQR
jgi:hypothetical protein